MFLIGDCDNAQITLKRYPLVVSGRKVQRRGNIRNLANGLRAKML